MTITARVKTIEIGSNGTLLRLVPFDKDISKEGAGSILIPDGIYPRPGNMIDIEIRVHAPLQITLFQEPEPEPVTA